MKLNSIFKVTVVCILLSAGFQSFGDSIPSWKEAMISQISSKLKAQMAQNAYNNRHGKSDQNSYIIELGSSDYRNKKEWVEERGLLSNKIFEDNVLTGFNADIVKINNNDQWLKSKTAFYTVIINDWSLMLESSIVPTESITSLSQFKATSISLESLKLQMEFVPDEISREVMEDKSTTGTDISSLYLYLFARISAYNDPNPSEKNAGSAPVQSIKVRQYIYTSFTDGDLRKKLLPVSSVATLGNQGLVAANIKIISDAVAAPQTALNLTYNYSIPVGEGQLVEDALKKPLRIIVEEPSDRNRSVYDYTNLIASTEKLNEVTAMCANLRQTGGTGNIFVKTFYTDYRMDAERLKKIKDYTQQLDKNDLVIWIHFKTDKEVTGDLYFGPGLEERLTKNYVDHTKAFLAGALKLGHKFTSIPIKGISYVASNLGKLLSLTEIPAIYYDPGLGEQYNPAFYIMYYVGSTSSSGGVGIIANSITSDDDNFALKIRDGAMRDFGNRQLEFAFITGLWNGTVTELASFSQAVSMICDAYTDPPAIKEVNQIINSLLNGQAYDAVIQQVKDRYDSRQSSYAILHNSGRDVIAVITLFIGVGELNGAVKVSKTFATMAEAAKMLDFLTLTRYLSKTVNGIKLYKLVITNSTYFFKVLKQNTSIAFKLVNDVGVVLKNTDVSILRQVEWQLADGSIVKSTIFVDPSDNINGAIRYTKDLVKDAYGNRVIEVTDNAGKTHAVVEVKDATKIVDDAGELLTLLAKAEAKLPTPELKAAFRSDFGNNLEMLRRFDAEGGLVEAWKKMDDAGLAALRKDPIQLQKFDDIINNNNLGLDADGLGDLLKSPQAKGLTWDNPDKVLDVVKRSSDANIQGLGISHKKFPAPANGTDNFVLKNAKQYQAEASGDAALSFNKGGVSFDDVAANGKLVDRKFGHGASVFDEDGGVLNQVRANSIVDQARRQLAAVSGDGTKLRWEISTETGANGIEQLFFDNSALIPGIDKIEVVHVAQNTIIP